MKYEIDDIIEKYIADGYFPSAVCKVIHNKRVLYEEAFGEVNTNTIYDVASLSKIVTSTQILMLVEEGRIGLDTSIDKYIPEVHEYRTLKERLGKVTIKQLLTHHSGIIDWYPFYSEKGTFYEVLEKVLSIYPNVEGTMYSDLNFMLLGEIIKKVTDLTLEESLEKYIKSPLKVDNICYCPKDKRNIAPTSYGNMIEEQMCADRNISFDNWRSHEYAFTGEVNDGNCHYFFKGMAGHAGIFADVRAYEAICQMYLNGSELFRSAMREQSNGRGLGWQISESYPKGCGHSGFTGTSLWICESEDIIAITYTNRLYTKKDTKNLEGFRKELHHCILRNIGSLSKN